MDHSPAEGPQTPGDRGPSRSRANVLRWQIGYGTFGVPQAAAPIAFALIALPITGSAESGAALVFAMTAAQILGSVPITRLGERFGPVGYLRTLIAFRTLGLIAVTILAAVSSPLIYLMIAVVVAGLVNGAAYGHMRSLLNHLVEPAGMPRALGIAATLNEVAFASSPVLASVLGAWSPVAAMTVVSILGAGPMLLIPSIPEARPTPAATRRAGRRSPVPGTVWIWLFASGATGAAIAGIEVGAVSFALSFGLNPAWAFLFALALCIGSVLGGIWVSIRNRMPGRWKVTTFFAITTAAFTLLLIDGPIAVTLAGALVVGWFLPMLDTFYLLALDALAPEDRRAEMFALLRTTNALGIMATSGLLALFGLTTALFGALGLLVIATALAAVYSTRGRRRRQTVPLG
ncbi:MFS transporter [Brevibacterium sp.]|uniref:MFS transporter n=1 Tax=Brevibacterium sp. TaxID=1701 RepID=UPI002647AF97|nr:MFS transporter [Brevibacterium sp.]MDN5807346.1 MFS transporter [Brevibacterium sp.]MDN5909692.1 MFS transporter [Brevibacterium sp.]MDN6133776.1 MFS transporter [Brevibacterium sp.]MDN6190022.1 MFS transporter [Brevibacterium sp.]MDN6528634.1 MFS transporter [Brevibacterium sp.]